MARIAVVGVGHLGESVLTGLLRSGIDQDDIRGIELIPERARDIARKHGIDCTHAGLADARQADIILIAVRPKDVRPVVEEIAAGPVNAVVCTLAAGIEIKAVEEGLGGGPVVRAMTNTASAHRQAVTALTRGGQVRDTQFTAVKTLFEHLGSVVEIPEEQQNMATALAGSGPAFLYYLADAMAQAATEYGIERKDADTMVEQMLRGAGVLLQESGEEPSELIGHIATPGGTTKAGLSVLDDRETSNVIRKAVLRTAQRSKELSAG
ncbi:pyrroline-5-carboxylate reductase [Salininema proteolyticum]|uniref:Pyrroline-5-carboxylate reductase n=1 Tax=Salininema proteolyticum TaxID=1607685 RepID=A0ABV8U0X7_9ACTN